MTKSNGDTSQLAPYLENISESTAACLVTMVQGNLLALGLGHWIIASQTGVVAGFVTATALLLSKTRKRWVVSLLLGLVTAIVDFFIHPGMFGPVAAEAVVTGVAAALLSYSAGSLFKLWRGRADHSDKVLS